MKNPLLFLLSFFGIIPAFSQITITQNDMPGSGDSVRVSIAAGVGSIDPSLTGANYFWDYSTLIPTAQQEYRYATPTALPFNFLSTIAFLNPTPDSLPLIGNVPSNFTDYFKVSSGSYRQNGMSFQYTPITSFDIPVVYTASDYIYRFPMNYGNADTSDGQYAINFPGLPYIGQSIHRENAVDGWGTLITPYDTFTVIRQVSYVQRIDTISLDSVTGFAIPRPREIEYKWLANGNIIPVLEIDAQMIANNEVVTNVVYPDNYDSTLFQVGINESPSIITNASFYPNPSQGSSWLTFHLNEIASVTISISDISGRQVKNFPTQMGLPGNNSRILDLNGLSAGTYYLTIFCESTRITQKIVLIN
ncbi:hypothetical protein BH09BAC5_BH09BAC5_01980 [soil metagenome]